MTRFLRLAFLIAFFVQIFVVNSQDIFADKLQSIDEKLDKHLEIFKNESQTQAKEMKILKDQIQQLQLQFEKFLNEQAEQTNRKLAEELANEHEKSREIVFELIQQGKEKQQEIESLHEKLKAEQLISKNLNENLEQELLRSSNISAQLQICNQNSTKTLQEMKIEKLKLEEPLLLQPCEFNLNQANTDKGIFQINLNETELEPFDVNCQRIDEEAWLIIQRRHDGSENFYRNWTDYKNGFGDLNGEFWLGLEKLHQLTKNFEWELKIWLRDDEGKEGFARYKKFKVGSETKQYKLTVGEYSGNVGDDLQYNNGQKFSTPDRDNDELSEGSCAIYEKGAWWFNACGSVWLNGFYNSDDTPYSNIYWRSFDFKMKYSQMAIRRLK